MCSNGVTMFTELLVFVFELSFFLGFWLNLNLLTDFRTYIL